MNTQKLPIKPQIEDSGEQSIQVLYLNPEQIAENWDDIKIAIEAALPPTTFPDVDVLGNVLKGILKKDIQCWGLYVDGDLKALATTTVMLDLISGVSNLLLYSLYGYEHVDLKTWFIALEYLRKFAKSRKCHKVIAYTREEKVVQLVEMLKGDTSWKFVTLEVQ